MLTYDIHRREEGQIRVSSRVCVIWERAECGFLQYVGEGSQVVVMREKCLPTTAVNILYLHSVNEH